MNVLSQAFEGHRFAVISGGPGTGKSQLAAEYAHGVEKGFWTTGGDSVDQMLVSLAGVLGITQASSESKSIAEGARLALARMDSDVLWVVDDLRDLGLVNELVNSAGQARVLITTRDSRHHLLDPMVSYHHLNVLLPGPATQLLCSRNQTHCGDPVLEEIAESVGRLPLALEMLSIRLAQPLQNPAGLLEEMNRTVDPLGAEIFHRAVGTAIPRLEGVHATIVGTLNRLSERSRKSISPLGFLGESPMPVELIEALCSAETPAVLSDLLEEWTGESVVSISAGYVTVHSLTRAVIRTSNAEGVLEETVRAIDERLDDSDSLVPWKLAEELPHYAQVFDRYEESEEMGQTLLWRCRSNLGISYRRAGGFEDAIRLNEETLKASERVLGADHPDTLTSKNNLANSYWSAGRVEEAISLNEETLEARERVQGADHPDTLISKISVAASYRSAGRVEEAIPLEEETLKASERVLGADHPNTLAFKSNLAYSYRSAGRVEEAISLYEETLKASERVLGADHPNTLASKNGLAVSYRSAGRVEEAIRLHEETLEACERVLGADHPDTLTTKSNLATSYRSAGRVEDAIRLHEETLKASERVLGADHPNTLSSKSNLAASYRSAGRDDDADRLENSEDQESDNDQSSTSS